MMQRVIPLLLLAACMPAPPELENESAIPDSAFAQLHRQVEVLAQADIPLWDFKIHIYIDANRFLSDTHASAEEIPGWTNAVNKIGILALDPLPDVAAAVAHQLGHVHFEQGAHDPDWEHERVEWFGEGGLVDVVWQMINEEAQNGAEE